MNPPPNPNPFNPGGLQVLIPNHNNNGMPDPNNPFWNPVVPPQAVAPIDYQFQNIGIKNVPRGSENLISRDDIEENDEMVDFQGERALGRFYKKNTFNSLEHKPVNGKKVNPFTRVPIEAAVNTYKAHLVGGKKKLKSKKVKKSQKMKKTRKLKKSF